MGFFSDENRLKKIDALRISYFFIFLLAIGLTELGRYVYRPFIYANNINDFGIADSMGNLGGIIVQIFFGMTILNPTRPKGLRLILLFVGGYILYEFLQPWLPKGTFDWKDVYGTFIGGIIGLLLYLGLHQLLPIPRPDEDTPKTKSLV